MRESAKTEKEEKRIIHVVHVHEKFYPYLGGSTFRLLNLLNGINKQNSNFYFTVLCENHTKKLPEREILQPNIEIVRFNNYFTIPLLLFNLSKKRKIHIIHAHNYRPFLLAFISNIFLRKKIILEMHSIYKISFLKQSIVNILFKIVRKNRIITLSETSKKYFSRLYKTPQKKIEVIYNGIDINRFRNCRSVSKSIDYKIISKFISKFNLRIGYIGSFYSWQGVFSFVEVAKEVVKTRKDVGFIMVGCGPTFLETERLIRRYSLGKNILIHGAVPEEEIPVVYNLIDILLIPRPSTLATATAIPLKPIEALACGKIVVGTRIEGLLELKDKVGGGIFLFDSLKRIISYLEKFNIKNGKLKDIPSGLNTFSYLKQSYNLIKIYKSL